MQRPTDLPPPPGVKPVQGPRVWRWIVSGVILIGLAAAAFYVPIPSFYAYLPGPVRDVEKLVEVEGAETYSSEGELLLTTVSVDVDVTFFDLVGALLDDDSDVVDSDSVTGGRSLKELEREQRDEMASSKRSAQEVALAALDIARPHGDGARVAIILDDTPAEESLEEGDRIVRVDGRRVETSCDVGSAIDRHEAGDTVEMTVVRDGSRRRLDIEAIANPQGGTSAFIGFTMEDVNYRFDPGVEVGIDTGEIGGPSAGLMFTLAIYDQLTPDDLTRGRSIAGTGTIACDGGVGPIGGIRQKVAGAEEEGATVFLAPAGNFEEAEAAAGEIEVVSVSDFTEAIEYLEGS
ncbi:MAG TPA: PDZ domain-containing protein [Actinomycetota bacterium]|nr:PDZ domain-containing protein [Actinomycetota bacterium]